MAGAGGLANEIRAGLEEAVSKTAPRGQRPVRNPLDDLFAGKPVRQHIKEFGAIFGTIFYAVCASKVYHNASAVTSGFYFVLGTAFAVSGYLAPSALRPLWRGWMKFAHYLSMVSTFIVLSVAWVLGFIPMGIIVKLTGVKSIDRSFDRSTESYWIKRDSKYDDFQRLKNQF